MSDNTRFSQRMGYIPAKAIQFESVDAQLKNMLWDESSKLLNDAMIHVQYSNEGVQTVVHHIWVEYLRRPYDSFALYMAKYYHRDNLNDRWSRLEFLVEHIRKFFYDESTKWYQLFDLIEHFFAFNTVLDIQIAETVANMNIRLEEEASGYRIVNQKFVLIVNKLEIHAIENASTPATAGLSPVAIHMQRAMGLLADRESPDYRNSIKESISAVESLCKLIAGLPNDTLGPALDKAAQELGVNDHIRDGIKKLYKYTNDAHGIRHGLKDQGLPNQSDALFMAITCSEIVNFLTEKARQQDKLPK